MSYHHYQGVGATASASASASTSDTPQLDAAIGPAYKKGRDCVADGVDVGDCMKAAAAAAGAGYCTAMGAGSAAPICSEIGVKAVEVVGEAWGGLKDLFSSDDELQARYAAYRKSNAAAQGRVEGAAVAFKSILVKALMDLAKVYKQAVGKSTSSAELTAILDFATQDFIRDAIAKLKSNPITGVRWAFALTAAPSFVSWGKAPDFFAVYLATKVPPYIDFKVPVTDNSRDCPRHGSSYWLYPNGQKDLEAGNGPVYMINKYCIYDWPKYQNDHVLALADRTLAQVQAWGQLLSAGLRTAAVFIAANAAALRARSIWDLQKAPPKPTSPSAPAKTKTMKSPSSTKENAWITLLKLVALPFEGWKKS